MSGCTVKLLAYPSISTRCHNRTEISSSSFRRAKRVTYSWHPNTIAISNGILWLHNSRAEPVNDCRKMFRVVASKNISDYTQARIEEWLGETANADMLKAGNFEDLRTKRETMGGFVRVHVSCSSFR